MVKAMRNLNVKSFKICGVFFRDMTFEDIKYLLHSNTEPEKNSCVQCMSVKCGSLIGL